MDEEREKVLFLSQKANFFGIKSLGARQVRGNGELVITTQGIRFTRWLPHKEIFIPADRILGVTRTRSFLKKTIFRPLIKVTFLDPEGREDEIAWFVRDLEGLEAALKKLGAPLEL